MGVVIGAPSRCSRRCLSSTTKTTSTPLAVRPRNHAGSTDSKGLSVDDIVDTAISIADSRGLDAVTVRRVAQQLDVAPMTLYTYIPGKAELIDLMLDAADAAYAAMRRSAPAGTGWRARAAAVTDDNRALYAAHPWAATVSTARPPLGPGKLAKYEHELQAFTGPTRPTTPRRPASGPLPAQHTEPPSAPTTPTSSALNGSSTA